MTTAFRTEEDATGFLVYVDGLTLERDAAQAEASELRDQLATARTAHNTEAEYLDAVINDLHMVIANLRLQLGIRP